MARIEWTSIRVRKSTRAQLQAMQDSLVLPSDQLRMWVARPGEPAPTIDDVICELIRREQAKRERRKRSQRNRGKRGKQAISPDTGG